MKKRLLLFALCALPFLKGHAQEFSPFTVSPYAGITAAQVNPASIAGSRYKFDITVFGASAGMHNDFMLLSRKKHIFNINLYQDLWKQRSDMWNGDFSQDLRDVFKHYLERGSSNWDKSTYSGYIGAQVDLLNLMWRVNDRFSLGLGYSMKAIAKADDIAEGILAARFKDFIPGTPNSLAYPRYVSSDNAGGALGLYQQVAVTAAYTLVNADNHKIKLGATGKLIFGGKSAYATAESMNVDYLTGSVSDLRGTAGKASKSKMGFGGDVGIEYEYQPDALKGNEIAEYRLKLGVSILDLGSYKTKNGIHANLRNAGAGMPSGFDDLLAMYSDGASGDYNMGLPTMITAQADYNIGKGFFVNFTPYISLNSAKENKLSKFTSFNLTPHYEMHNFGVSLPLQMNEYGKFTAGIGLRAWRHLWVGTNTLAKNLWPFGDNKNYSANFHVMVKIPIGGKVSDRDGDGIPDSKDLCPDQPGLKRFQGCPDTDGDGIPDNEDKCPNEPGPASTGGCPDRDGDGIIDKDDRCPDEAGPAALQGCPDRDGDGIADIDDACPDEAGPASTKGCPDRDGDGVADKDDRCPDDAGPVALQGCPDRDGDGIPDIDDKCPDVAGVKEYDGCPAPVNETVVLFAIDKFNVRPQYYEALNTVAKKMIEDPTVKVNIVGHTDNTYLRSYNMNLSKKRAESVKNYLVGKKADAKRISTQYYGPDKPVADNKTVDGRTKNRRAEITIVIK